MPGMRALLALAAVLAAAGAATAAVNAPARVTLDGVAGVRPGMSAAAVSARWGLRLRPSYEVRPTCGLANFERPGVKGHAIFMPRGRLAPSTSRRAR